MDPVTFVLTAYVAFSFWILNSVPCICGVFMDPHPYSYHRIPITECILLCVFYITTPTGLTHLEAGTVSHLILYPHIYQFQAHG